MENPMQLVGDPGLEPGTPRSQSEYSSQLSQSPTRKEHTIAICGRSYSPSHRLVSPWLKLSQSPTNAQKYYRYSIQKSTNAFFYIQMVIGDSVFPLWLLRYRVQYPRFYGKRILLFLVHFSLHTILPE